MRRVVITGATSSIGTALVEECIKQNIEVLAIVNPGSKNICRIIKKEMVHIVECSINQYNAFDSYDFNDKYDAFIHLAWAATQGDEARNLLLPQIKNIEYTMDAIELAERLGCKVFVGAGSQAEYGRTNEELTESTETKPETAYGMAKLCAGQMTRLACKNKGIRHVWTRILSAYGPNCQPQTVLNYTLIELINCRSPILSAGEQIWDFIYTGDVAKALLLLAEKGVDGDIYVIGSGVSKPLKDYLNEARQILEKNENRVLPKLNFGAKPYSNSAVMHLACDISKLKRDTGFEIETSFEEGIIHTIEWLKLIMSKSDI